MSARPNTSNILILCVFFNGNDILTQTDTKEGELLRQAVSSLMKSVITHALCEEV